MSHYHPEPQHSQPPSRRPSSSKVPSWLFEADERICRIAWSRLTEPGDLAAAEAVEKFGVDGALTRLIEGDADLPERWRLRLPNLEPQRDLRLLDQWQGRVVIPGDAHWPSGLDDLGPRRPWCLWVRGPMSPAVLAQGSVAVVGARAATTYGLDLCATLVAGLADRGVVTVSGGAYGIDAAAHQAALALQAPTMAVLACGADRLYPSGNTTLLREVSRVGAVISELPPGSAPTRWRFLERNRLIAAMTKATVVVEAAWRSGAQNTARHAMELGRPVGACPGPVTSAASAGCHRLLRQGATCITDAVELLELASDIGDELNPPEPEVALPRDALEPLSARVLEALPVRRSAGLDAISAMAGIEPRAVLAALGGLVAQELAIADGAGWRLAQPPR